MPRSTFTQDSVHFIRFKDKLARSTEIAREYRAAAPLRSNPNRAALHKRVERKASSGRRRALFAFRFGTDFPQIRPHRPLEARARYRKS